MKRKIISIILIIAVSLPMFRVHTVKSSAVLPALVVEVIKAVLIGTAGSVAASAAYAMGETIADEMNGGELDVNNAINNLKNYANTQIAQSVTNIVNTNGITVTVGSDNSYYVSVDSSLTGEDLALATKVAEKLNAIPNFDEICSQVNGSNTISGGGVASMKAYEKIKSAVGTATSELVQQKAIEFAKEAGMTLIDNGALPAYNFDFSGPMQPGLELPTLATTADTFLLDGFTLTKPFVLNESNSSWWNGMYQPKKENYSSLGLKSYNGLVGYQIPGGTRGGIYVIYNDTIFSFGDYGVSENPRAYGCGIANMLHGLRSPDGKYLKDFFATAEEVEKACLPRGFFYTTNPDTSYITNVSSSTVDTDDFTTSIPVGPIQIPRTEGEQVVTDGINLGLISENPEIELDENGNIVKIDGIDTAKLMELLQTIANNGSISFDSIEQYLQAITAMLSASNADTKTLNTVITNLNELTKAQNKSIEEINTNVAAISEALTAEKAANLDFELPEASIFDKFPFSLPWDFYRIISLLCTKEKEPVFTIPIKTNLKFGSLDYDVDEKIVLDLTCFKINGVDIVRVFTNTTSYLFFIVCLVFATKKLIWK